MARSAPRAPWERWIRRALLEAEKGRGRTSPNPVVGAVVVREGRVIAAGHHERAGGPHAEVAALQAAGDRAKGADLFVTLEPCNHYGRTPPCTDAILAAGVRRVVVGSIDPNPLVRGRGIRRLRAAGVEVHTGVLGADCDAANEAWFKFITRKLPWVVLKVASTLDGKLFTATGDSRWVSGEAARALVHRWRDELDAVLVGIGTVLADDPRLTARPVGSPPGLAGPGGDRSPRDPVRVVVDSTARLSPSAAVLRRGSAPALVACTLRAKDARIRALERSGAEVLRCRTGRDGRVDLKDLLRRLAARDIVSVLVEGGAAIQGSFLREGLWDELRLFLTPKVAGEGASSWAGFPARLRMADSLQMSRLTAESVGEDLLVRARPGSGSRSR